MTWQPWQGMWALAFAIYCGCKWLTWHGRHPRRITFRDLGYLLLWPGLDAVAFLGPRTALKPRQGEWAFAWSKLVMGMVALYIIARLLPSDYPYLVGWAGMIGIVMILHFGLFHLLSCAWRRGGVIAKPLMNYPFASRSLSEFWGQRWNTAFRDLTYRHLFRPLVPRIGVRNAMIAVFGISGLVHDAVISVPARGGHGGPTLFFVLQSMGIMAERSFIGRKFGLGSGWRGRFFAASLLVAPAFVLFHRPFVVGVVVPFMRATGAL